MREITIQNKILLRIGGYKNCRLFRNPIGFDSINKNMYGLCKGASDLIGITKIKITKDMIGKCVGVFTAIEVKAENGKPSKEQINFIKTIKEMGGMAYVAHSEEEADDLLNNWFPS